MRINSFRVSCGSNDRVGFFCQTTEQKDRTQEYLKGGGGGGQGLRQGRSIGIFKLESMNVHETERGSYRTVEAIMSLVSGTD